ncbi:MAG: metal ABC transporter permease [Desulfobacteraceae bacterium]|nr:metal ABC transporter permease [Desulfobacteraceae bacterium]
MTSDVLSQLGEALNYSFIQRALIAGSFTAACCALLGVFLVLRRFSLIGDGLGHVSFGAVGLCLLLNLHPVFYSIPVVLLASLWILRLSDKTGVQGDAAIGLTSSVGVAGGLMLAGIGGGYNVDLFSYLFGNILIISRAEVIISVFLSVTVVAVISLLYHDMFVTAFEHESAHVLGIQTGKINTVLVMCTALTVVLSIRIVGIMLVSSLIILPGIAALQIASGFRSTLLLAVLFAVSSIWIGIGVSFVFDLPTGATIVFVNFGWFVMSAMAARHMKRS